MRLAASATLVALLLAPSAAAQLVNPIVGGYDENYIVAGRILDSEGKPASGARIVVAIRQEGVTSEEVRATANCKGDFIVPFQGLDVVSPKGRAAVTVRPPPGEQNATSEHALDPFFRHTQARVRLPYAWTLVCASEDEPDFSNLVTFVGRFVNRTSPYTAHDATFEGRPYSGPIALRWIDASGAAHCPPTGDGRCETLYTDERGDVRYSFIFPAPVEAAGTMQAFAAGKFWNASVDPTYRIAVFHVEMTGQGPPRDETPGPAALATALSAVVAVLLLRRRQRP